eukprot:scaffold14640_cov70-Phaeocystis_antarctica.AAC.2
MRSKRTASTRWRTFRRSKVGVASTFLGRTSQDRSRGTLCPTWPAQLGCTSPQGTPSPRPIPQDSRCHLGKALD